MLHPDDLVAIREMGERALLGEIDMDTEFRVFHSDRSIHFLSTGQKFNGVEESLGIEMKVKDEVTQEIKTTTKNAFR